ncbi:MAG: acyl-CoA dehydratase activase-related protein [Patescibacteria group bacterium]
MKVGIPRAGLYHLFHPFWSEFFSSLGFEVVISAATDKEILSQGLKIANSEMCLPMKIMYGHILSLKDRCDFLFLPQLGAAKWGQAKPGTSTFFCPYFVGLADLMAAEFPQMKFFRPQISFWDNLFQAADWLEFAREIGFAPAAAKNAFSRAEKAYEVFRQQQIKEAPLPRDKKIALVGRPYLIYDHQANLDIIKKINQRGYQVATVEMIPDSDLKTAWLKLPPDFVSHWYLTNKTYGAINHFSQRPDISGIIFLVPFNCGPDFLVEYLVIQKARAHKPITTISIDESTGEAGLLTRLDAFIDILK